MERRAHLIDMMVRDEPGVSALQFYGAKTIDDAYGNPTGSLVGGAGAIPMFTVLSSRQFRSPSIVNRRWSWYGENLKNTSRVAFDPSDYVGDVGTELPSDEEIWFVRVQESRPAAGGFLEVQGAVDTGDPKLGSIYVVPTPIFFGQPGPGLTLQGTAPAATTAVAGAVPPIDLDMQVPNPMHLVFPRRTAACFVNCTSGTLLVSTGWGDPLIEVAATEDSVELGGGVKELVLAGSGGAAIFSIYTITALGPGG
jgi:hypothetical protein